MLKREYSQNFHANRAIEAVLKFCEMNDIAVNIANFQWKEIDDSSKEGSTQWSPFSETTKYFEPSTKDFMINYRVENLESLVEELKKEGVTILDTIETYDYGKFVHIMDVEGNKVQLWEPID